MFGEMLIILFGLVNLESSKGKLLASLWVALFASREVIIFIILLILKSVPLPELISSRIAQPTLSVWGAFQMLAVLAVFPILLYNGTPGPRPRSKIARKALQYSFYLFYPVHILVILFVFHIVL